MGEQSQNLDPSYKMDLDLGMVLGGKTPHLIAEEIWYLFSIKILGNCYTEPSGAPGLVDRVFPFMQEVKGSTPTGGTCPKDFSDPVDQDIHTQCARSWK